MFPKMSYTLIALIVLSTVCMTACASAPSTTEIPNPADSPTAPFLPNTPTATLTPPTLTPAPPTPNFSAYAFPDSIDPAKEYMFYLHGKIIEDQGLPAISPDFGEYEYEAILKKLSEHGFVVLSEQRSKDTDALEYAQRIVGQVNKLLDAGVPASSVTVAGASKGSFIAIYVSHLLENRAANFVLLGSCGPDVEYLMQNQIFLYGNVLSIYDSVDNFAGSCKGLFQFSEGKGISEYNEIVLHVGTGHGILYKALDEWILPLVDWAKKDHSGD